MKPKLLIVDDDEGIQTQMKWALTDDYEVILAQDRESARQVMVETQPDVVLLDLGLPPRPNDTEEGFKALGELLADSPLASGPTSTSRAGCISPVEIPFKYSHGIAASKLAVLRTYGGTSAE